MKHYGFVGVCDYILIAALMLAMAACSRNNFDTGIKGTLQLGYIDCMLPMDTTNVNYHDVVGNVYFVTKSAFDDSTYTDRQQLKESSITKTIKKGKLAAELPADTFYIMTDEISFANSSNMIVITSGQVLERDFKFWLCGSF